MAPATVLDRARRALHERRDAGLAAGMGFTYHNPDRSTDPQRAVPGRPLDHRRRPLVPRRRRRRPHRPGPQARVARYAWVDHYTPLRAGLRAIARRLRAADDRAVSFADDNSIVDREVAHLAGLGWFGKNANLLLPGAGSWFVLGCVVTTRRVPAGRAGRRRLRHRAGAASTPARPAPSSPPASSTPTAAWPGSCRSPGPIPEDAARRRSATASTAATTARRPARRRCASAAATSARSTRRRGRVGRRARPARRRRPHAARPPRPLVHRRPRPALAAAQRPGRARQHGRRPHDPRVVATLARYRRRRRPDPRRARPLGQRASSASPTARGRSDGEAPPRDERLPAQDRRDPVAAVGVVAAAAAGPVRRAHQPVRRARRSSTAPRRTASSAPGSRCCCRTRGWCGASTPWPARSAPTSSCSTRPCRSASSARRCELPYDVVLHGAEVTVPGPAARHQAGARQRAAPRPARRLGRGVRGAARPSGRPGGPLPVTVVPPGVDIERFRPLDDDRARRGPRAGFGLPVDAELIVSISRLVPRKGFDVAIRGRGAAGAEPARPRARHLRRRARRAPAAAPGRRARRAGARSSAGCPTTSCPTSTAAPTCSPWSAAAGGAGSSRRASASCSSRPRRAACPRSPATRAGRPRPSPTA